MVEHSKWPPTIACTSVGIAGSLRRFSLNLCPSLWYIGLLFKIVRSQAHCKEKQASMYTCWNAYQAFTYVIFAYLPLTKASYRTEVRIHVGGRNSGFEFQCHGSLRITTLPACPTALMNPSSLQSMFAYDASWSSNGISPLQALPVVKYVVPN